MLTRYEHAFLRLVRICSAFVVPILFLSLTRWNACGTVFTMREPRFVPLTVVEWIPDILTARRRGADLSDLKTKADLRKLDCYLLRREECWTEIPLGKRGEWTAACRLVSQRGTPVVAEVRIYPHDKDAKHRCPGEWSGEFAGNNAIVPPGGIQAALLRSIKLRLPPKAWRHFYSQWGTKVREERKRRPGAGRPDIDYARLARRYVELWPKNRNVLQSIAREMKETTAHVRDMVFRARELDLLTGPRNRGMPGGVLTDKAKALLRQKRRRR